MLAIDLSQRHPEKLAHDVRTDLNISFRAFVKDADRDMSTACFFMFSPRVSGLHGEARLEIDTAGQQRIHVGEFLSVRFEIRF